MGLVARFSSVPLFPVSISGLAGLSLPADWRLACAQAWQCGDVAGGSVAALSLPLSFSPSEIQKLVLEGRVGEAIETTQLSTLWLLEHNPNLPSCSSKFGALPAPPVTLLVVGICNLD